MELPSLAWLNAREQHRQILFWPANPVFTYKIWQPKAGVAYERLQRLMVNLNDTQKLSAEDSETLERLRRAGATIRGR